MTGTLMHVPVTELKSPVARAVVPVLGGAAVLAMIGLFTWLMAAYISGGGGEGSERLAPSTFTVGKVDGLSETVAKDGPLFFPELGTAIGTRSIVVDHTGRRPGRRMAGVLGVSGRPRRDLRRRAGAGHGATSSTATAARSTSPSCRRPTPACSRSSRTARRS